LSIVAFIKTLTYEGLCSILCVICASGQ
jgi:hypothetical protein